MTSLAARIAARESCAVRECPEPRVADAIFCHRHLTEHWSNRLDRQSDGTYLPRLRLTTRDITRSVA
jgi:hypothetical protein